jgi:hypothetical protein
LPLAEKAVEDIDVVKLLDGVITVPFPVNVNPSVNEPTPLAGSRRPSFQVA